MQNILIMGNKLYQISSQLTVSFQLVAIILSFSTASRYRKILRGGVQFFIEVLCILKARYFKNSGNNVLSLDCCNHIKFLHIRNCNCKHFSVVKEVCENKLGLRPPTSICKFLSILRTNLCLRKCNFSCNTLHKK